MVVKEEKKLEKPVEKRSECREREGERERKNVSAAVKRSAIERQLE